MVPYLARMRPDHVMKGFKDTIEMLQRSPYTLLQLCSLIK
jgi:hypothetical protein